MTLEYFIALYVDLRPLGWSPVNWQLEDLDYGAHGHMRLQLF